MIAVIAGKPMLPVAFGDVVSATYQDGELVLVYRDEEKLQTKRYSPESLDGRAVIIG